MKILTLKQRILFAFTGIIVILAVCIYGLGYNVLRKEIFSRTQHQLERSLDSARMFYQEEINRIGESLGITDVHASEDIIKNKLRLDYFYRVPADKALSHFSEIVRKAALQGRSLGGTRIISEEEIKNFDIQVQDRARIPIVPTPKARPENEDMLTSAMTKEYALVICDDQGKIVEIVYAGRIINQDYKLVDKIRNLVFGNENYAGKPIGTVTIFQNDIRISTNVINEDGQRAIGTCVSEEVYQQVVEQGRRWLDRAFVVTDWYKTAYEPIRNIDGEIVGILYVGVLEQPFNDMLARILLAFVSVILLASVLAFVLSIILAGSIVNPMRMLTSATRKMADGQLGQEVHTNATILELNHLAESFNDMSVRLKERETSLKISNEKLADLNKSYMDLLGFVAHELKGLLASAVINAYSLRDGFLGMINFKQKKAVDSICRNLDYLDATVKKFLNLSRIERGNLEVNRTQFSLRKDIFDVSLETFEKMRNAKKMELRNELDPDIKVKADLDLMMIVANNLVNNAIKYGNQNGRISISSKDKGDFVTVEVYNDSRPIRPEMMDQLFKKFSRLDVPEKKQVKGTGLGLYITKQIIEAHGGTITVEPRENGNSFIFTISKNGPIGS